MDEKLNKQSIDRLDISDNCMELLKSNDIETIGQLCKKSKTDLKKLNLVQEEVNKIDKFSLVIEKKNKFDIYADASSLTKDLTSIQPKEVRSYRVNVRRLCFIISSVAKNMYAKNKDKFNFFNFNFFFVFTMLT